MFEGSQQFSFICRRKFGQLQVIKDPETFIDTKDLGFHVLDISKKGFLEKMKAKNSKLKSAFMNQSFAGIGNVYADEIL